MTYVYAGSIRVAGLTTQTTATGTENNTLYYHGDHLGSSSLITDDNGTVIRNISYQPWGNIQSNTQAPGATTDYDPPQKFTGQILDDSTGLYYYGARYYDPTLRRFITPDPIVQSPYDPQSLNRYAYCRNNPLIYIDPSGHLFLEMMLFSAFTDVAFRRTNGDVHNFRDATRYAVEGAAIGAGIAGIATGISYLNPVFNINVGYGGIPFAGMSMSNSGSSFNTPFSGAGDGPTGSINIANLKQPKYTKYSHVCAVDVGNTTYVFDPEYENIKEDKPPDALGAWDVYASTLREELFLTPVPSRPEDAVEEALAAGSIYYQQKAWSHAASKGLLSPGKSSIFRTYMGKSKMLGKVSLVTTILQVGAAEYKALKAEWDYIHGR